MKNAMQYIVDDSGTKTSVIVPYSQWEKINADYDKLKKKFDVFLVTSISYLSL